MSRAVSFKYFSQSYSGGLPSVIPFTLQTSDKSKAFLKLRPDTEICFYLHKSLKNFLFFFILTFSDAIHLFVRHVKKFFRAGFVENSFYCFNSWRLNFEKIQKFKFLNFDILRSF